MRLMNISLGMSTTIKQGDNNQLRTRILRTNASRKLPSQIGAKFLTKLPESFKNTLGYMITHLNLARNVCSKEE